MNQFFEIWLRVRMAYAVIRGRSVMYRWEVSTLGSRPMNPPSFATENHFHDLDVGISV